MVQRVPTEFSPDVAIQGVQATSAPGSQMSQAKATSQFGILSGVAIPLAEGAAQAAQKAQANAKYQGVIDEYSGGQDSAWNNFLTGDSYQRGRALQAGQTGLAKVQASSLEDMQSAIERDVPPEQFVEEQAEKHKAFVAPAMAGMDAEDGMRLLNQSGSVLDGTGKAYTAALAKHRKSMAQKQIGLISNTAQSTVLAQINDPQAMLTTFRSSIDAMVGTQYAEMTPDTIAEGVGGIITTFGRRATESGGAGIEAANALMHEVRTNKKLLALEPEQYENLIVGVDKAVDAIKTGTVSNLVTTYTMASNVVQAEMPLGPKERAAIKRADQEFQATQHLYSPEQKNRIELAQQGLKIAESSAIRRAYEKAKLPPNPDTAFTPRGARDSIAERATTLATEQGMPPAVAWAHANIGSLHSPNPVAYAASASAIADGLVLFGRTDPAGQKAKDGSFLWTDDAKLFFATAQREYAAKKAGQQSRWQVLSTAFGGDDWARRSLERAFESGGSIDDMAMFYLRNSSGGLKSEKLPTSALTGTQGMSIAASAMNRLGLMFNNTSSVALNAANKGAEAVAMSPLYREFVAVSGNSLEGLDDAGLGALFKDYVEKNGRAVPAVAGVGAVLPYTSGVKNHSFGRLPEKAQARLLEQMVREEYKGRTKDFEYLYLEQASTGNVLLRGIPKGEYGADKIVRFGTEITPELVTKFNNLYGAESTSATESMKYSAEYARKDGKVVHVSGENRHSVPGTYAALAMRDLLVMDSQDVNPQRTRAVAAEFGNAAFSAGKAAASELGLVIETGTLSAQRPAKQEAAIRLFLPAERLAPGAAAKLVGIVKKARSQGVDADAVATELRSIYPTRVSDDELYHQVLPHLRTLIQP